MKKNKRNAWHNITYENYDLWRGYRRMFQSSRGGGQMTPLALACGRPWVVPTLRRMMHYSWCRMDCCIQEETEIFCGCYWRIFWTLTLVEIAQSPLIIGLPRQLSTVTMLTSVSVKLLVKRTRLIFGIVAIKTANVRLSNQIITKWKPTIICRLYPNSALWADYFRTQAVLNMYQHPKCYLFSASVSDFCLLL